MAQYNHEVLVNYLRDVYSMELLVRKIQENIYSTRKDIQHEQAIVAKAESTPIPTENELSPKKRYFAVLNCWIHYAIYLTRLFYVTNCRSAFGTSRH